MFKTTLVLSLALAALTVNAASFDVDHAKALKGDYAAQRNIAYGYSSYPYVGQDKNQMLACAWRIVIVKAGSERLDQSDISNQKLDCGKLDQTQRQAAEAQSEGILKRIQQK